jgi:phosphatidyl-myo-inositol dimannoside synthase
MLPRAMLVSRNFPPLIGGMERLNQQLLVELSRAFETYLIGPDGAERYAPNAEWVLGCRSKPIHLFLIWATIKAAYMAGRVKPNLILAGSGVNAFPAWAAAVISGARWGIYLHGLDLVVDNWIYRSAFMPIIRRADFWLANSQATAAVGRRAGLDPEKMYVLNPGVAIPEKLPSDDAVTSWRRKIAADARPILLSVGRLTQRKGLVQFIRNSLPAILSQIPDTLLVVVGGEPSNALASGAVNFDALRTVAGKVGAESNLRILGSICDDELALAYRAATVHVFPILSIPGDMEGFGMVAIEAAAHGLPTVAFDVGGVSDAVGHGVSGALVRAGRYDDFAGHVIRIITQGRNAGNESLCRDFAKSFSWQNFGLALNACPPIRRFSE